MLLPKFVSNWLIKRGFRRMIAAIERLPTNFSAEQVVEFAYSPVAELIQPWQFREELVAALHLLESSRPRNILEIGTANGGTLFCWCRIVRTGGKVLSIDLPEGKFGGGYPEWKIPFYKRFAKAGTNLQLIRNDSQSPETVAYVKSRFQDDPLDILFIDGDHTYEGVKKDYENYSTLVRKGGYIVFHDVADHPGSACDVKRFWNEVKQTSDYVEFINDPKQGKFGIGILTKNGTN